MADMSNYHETLSSIETKANIAREVVERMTSKYSGLDAEADASSYFSRFC